MGLDDLLTDSKAQPRHAAAFVGGIKGFKNAVQILLRNPNAIVGYRHTDPVWNLKMGIRDSFQGTYREEAAPTEQLANFAQVVQETVREEETK